MVDVAKVNMFGMPVGTFRWGRRTGGARGTGRNEEIEGGDGRGRWMPDG